jgi:pimeloyl-ACP methyl ester carboxylesterase
MAALDALKQRYGFKRFHLVGHSGGGHTVAGLVQSRSDIGCAVIASAGVSLRSMLRDRGYPIVGKLPLYDPIDHVNAMKQRTDLRLFVVSDRNDKLVSFRSQLEFVERVKAHNLPITHVTATATDKNSHDLFHQGLRLAVDCANEARDQVVVNKGSDQVPIPLRPPPSADPVPSSGTMPNNEPRKIKTLAVKGDQTDSAAPPAANPSPLQFMPPASQPVVLPPPSSPFASPRVVLYEEDPSDPQGKQYVGSVIWRTEPIKAGNQKPEIAVRADIEIPDRKFKMTMSFRHNTGTSLPASHTAELTFILPQDFSGGGVSNVPGILMKSNEQAPGHCPQIADTSIATTKVASCGTPLAGLAVKVTDVFFLVGFSNVDADRARNLQLLKERSWFDVPLVYANQRRATIAIETPGARAFKDALLAWGED